MTALLFDVALLAPRRGPGRLERIGEEAVRERINLAQPIVKAPARARVWLAGRLRRRAS